MGFDSPLSQLERKQKSLHLTCACLCPDCGWESRQYPIGVTRLLKYYQGRMTPDPRKVLSKSLASSPISAVDLFCGAGGLTYGLRESGIRVEAGIDIDEQAKFAYEENNPGSTFYEWDISGKNYTSIEKLFAPDKIRLLAGCAPCQPFSKLTNGADDHHAWDLLGQFSRLVQRIKPELVTMENVPELAMRGREIFHAFVKTLERSDYYVDWKIVSCNEYGIPQKRRRLVLVASLLGEISVPEGPLRDAELWETVKTSIAHLPEIASGESCPDDPLHAASQLSPLNLERIKATPKNGGSRADWPSRLVLKCHKKKSGKSYGSVYGRMAWDKPSPTMTTLCTGIGNGRFGHPTQDRAISLREAAILQSFPQEYEFWPANKRLSKKAVGRMIGNAVPPMLGEAIGASLIAHARHATP